MAKVYLFRKIAEPSAVQALIYEEAVSSVVEHVLQGGTGSIFNYGYGCGDWPDYADYNGCADSAGDAGSVNRTEDDVISRVINDIFNHVYTMELTMEINISIRYAELDLEQQQTLLDMNDNFVVTGDGHNNRSKQHFVSAPKDVYAYMRKTMKRMVECECESVHALFTIHVKQTNLEQSQKMYGKLHLVHFSRVVSQPASHSLPDSPMGALLKIINALASNNNKTHLRYHNIRLTRILKDILGSTETTVIINYSSDTALNPPSEALEAQKPVQAPTAGPGDDLPGEVWRALYKRERAKYRRLKEKVLNVELWSSNEEKLNLDELLEIQEEEHSSNSELRSSSSIDEANNARLALQIEQLYGLLDEKEGELQRNYERCQRIEERCEAHDQLFSEQRVLHTQVQQIKMEAELTMEELQQLQHMIKQLSLDHEQTNKLLKQKEHMLDRLNMLLNRANEELQQQKSRFKLKLTDYSELFNKLWRQQAHAMQAQEQHREHQLSEMFDTVCRELHSSHQTQLSKMKQLAELKEQELERLQQQHQQLLEAVDNQQQPPSLREERSEE